MASKIQIINPMSNAILPGIYDKGAEEPLWTKGVSNTCTIRHSTVNYAITDDRRPLQPFVVYHKDFSKILGPNPKYRVVAEEYDYPFAHEAGIWIPRTREVFFTSNQFYTKEEPENHRQIRISKIKIPLDQDAELEKEILSYEWSNVSPSSKIFSANGGTNYKGGMLFCQQGLGSVPGALVYMDAEPPYNSEHVLNNFYGRPFNAPNDIVVLPDGTIWFTDPDYAILQTLRRFKRLPNQVYRYDPSNGAVCAVADGFIRPNGICFSPDCKVCYITDTAAYDAKGTVDDAASSIYAFDVVNNKLMNKRLFAFSDSAAPDGIKCDSAGNVYSGCGDGVHVWNPDGFLIGKILAPQGIANLVFTDPGSLIMFNENRIIEIRFNATGAHQPN
ncbi:hypothetical protein V1511DRAFT_488668 [Dipodascopsis uninucleata]